MFGWLSAASAWASRVSRASLSGSDETEVKPAIRKLIEDEFRRAASIPVIAFPRDGAEIPDTPRLTLVVADPETEWTASDSLRSQVADWTKNRGKSPRLYPGALVWCLKKPGRDLRDRVELTLAWKRVAREVAEGTLGGEFDRNDRADLQAKVRDSEEAAKDEAWGGYRFAIISDGLAADGLKVIDLGAGHSSSGESLCGRVLAALKSEALLNESVGAGYIDRNWPDALKAEGAWPIASLRQSFLNGSLTRLVDPDAVLRSKIVEFVDRGDFGLASGRKADGTFERVWFMERVAADEVAFESGVFLLRKGAAEALKKGLPVTSPTPSAPTAAPPGPAWMPGQAGQKAGESTVPEPSPTPLSRVLRLSGTVPPEIWNRLGTRILPKLKSGTELRIGVDFTVAVTADLAPALAAELRQILKELGVGDAVRVD